MAERRMFHGAVVESDAFLDMPIGAQALYFHLGMSADDDGFVNGPKQVVRKLRRPLKELDLLIQKGLLIEMDGIVILRHWLVANSLKNDRLKTPRYPELAAKLYLLDNREYTPEPGEGRVSLLEDRRKKWIPGGILREEKGREPNRTEQNRTERKRV